MRLLMSPSALRCFVSATDSHLHSSVFHNSRKLSTTSIVFNSPVRWRHDSTHGNRTDNSDSNSNWRWNSWRMRRFCLAAALAAGGGSAGLYYAKYNKNSSSNVLLAASRSKSEAINKSERSGEEDVSDVKTVVPGEYRHDLPVYSMREVALHDSVERGVWMTYGRGVYDVSQFVGRHPGGTRALLMAAGGSTEPFWQLFAVHKEAHVLAVLEQYRIGNLSETDAISASETAKSGGSDSVWSQEPLRHPALSVNSSTPFNAETPLDLLGHSFYTPSELFYVRNHLPVPVVDVEDYQLEVDCRGELEGVEKGPEEGDQSVLEGPEQGDRTILSLSLHDLRSQFDLVDIDAVIMCAGNRRSEMTAAGERMVPVPRKVRGLSWGAGAVGNARWRGVRLSDVLHRAGCNLAEAKAAGIRHVCFEGLDTDAGGESYGASIPIEHALDPRADVLLVLEMNGQVLSRDHGYPVRVLVPGAAGARSVKWLSRVYLSAEESTSHWQRNDYKGFCPSTDWDSADYASQASIQQMPVTSAFCRPQLPSSPPGVASSTASVAEVGVQQGRVTCSGYAWSGGGRRIVRVDVSSDGGATWWPAQKLQQQQQEYDSSDASREVGHGHRRFQEVGRCWAWTLWSAELPVTAGTSVTQLCVKAVDDSYNSQPETFDSIWNFRGVLSNAFHRINVQLKWRNQ